MSSRAWLSVWRSGKVGWLATLPALSLFAWSGCGGPADPAETVTVAAAVSGHGADGQALFGAAFPGTNGRSCGTCHVAADHFGLTPAHVAATLAANPGDALFNRIDADDPNADVPAYEHLSSEDDDAYCQQGGKVKAGSPDYVYCRKERDASRNAAVARADRKQRDLAEYMMNNPN